MADKNYELTFELSNGSSKKVQFTAPQGEKGDPGVYILSEGETIDDAPDDANVVIDPNGQAVGGVSSWEDLGSTFAEVVVLEETSPMYDEESGEFVFTDEIHLTPGMECTVTYNGTDYTCIAGEVDIEGITACVLGNIGAITEGEDTGEPFMIAVLPSEMWPDMGGITGMMYALDGSTNVVISITGIVETITPVPEKYLPHKGILYAGQINEIDFLYKTKDTSNPENKLLKEELKRMIEMGMTIYIYASELDERYPYEAYLPVREVGFMPNTGFINVDVYNIEKTMFAPINTTIAPDELLQGGEDT